MIPIVLRLNLKVDIMSKTSEVRWRPDFAGAVPVTQILGFLVLVVLKLFIIPDNQLHNDYKPAQSDRD